MILVECGPSTTVPAYSEKHQLSKISLPREAMDHSDDGNPIDTIVLCMFVGHLNPDNNCVGYPFLNQAWIYT
jgi:hypothetical protein